MIKRIFQIAMLCVLTPLLAAAQQWDEAQYRQIEQSIRTPHFADKAYVITQYGAKTTNTAAKNQKAIQKAIDLCSKKGLPHRRNLMGGFGVLQPLALCICFQG